MKNKMDMRASLFPHVNGEINEKEGSFEIPEFLICSFGDFPEYTVEAYSKRTGLEINSGKPWLFLERDVSLEKEHYVLLTEKDRVTVKASEDRGIIWALTSLYTIQENSAVPLGMIKDGPSLSHRGLSFDTVRYFSTVSEVKKIIEELSLRKMNVFHFHLSDDQGWRIESETFPKLCENGDFYTKRELRDIVEFARIRGVEVIPEIDMPGHTSAILATYPELGCFNKEISVPSCGGIFTDILCAGKEPVYSFIEKLLKEVTELFPSGRFHIGGDEAPRKAWKSCPDCKKEYDRLNCASYSDLQGHFSIRVSDILSELGKSVICWDESLKSDVRPGNMQIQYWNVNEKKLIRAFEEGGGDIIYSDMFELYLDYPYSMTPLKRIYGLKPHCGAKKLGISGIECAIWCEHIEDNENLEKHLFPRAFAVADAAWGGRKCRYGSYLDCIEKECRSTEKRGICCEDRKLWDTGKPGESLEYFRLMNEVPDEAQSTTEPAPLTFDYVFNFITRFFRIGEILPAYKIMTGKDR